MSSQLTELGVGMFWIYDPDILITTWCLGELILTRLSSFWMLIVGYWNIQVEYDWNLSSQTRHWCSSSALSRSWLLERNRIDWHW
jgi:hypothetical protein